MSRGTWIPEASASERFPTLRSGPAGGGEEDNKLSTSAARGKSRHRILRWHSTRDAVYTIVNARSGECDGTDAPSRSRVELLGDGVRDVTVAPLQASCRVEALSLNAMVAPVQAPLRPVGISAPTAMVALARV